MDWRELAHSDAAAQRRRRAGPWYRPNPASLCVGSGPSTTSPPSPAKHGGVGVHHPPQPATACDTALVTHRAAVGVACYDLRKVPADIVAGLVGCTRAHTYTYTMHGNAGHPAGRAHPRHQKRSGCIPTAAARASRLARPRAYKYAGREGGRRACVRGRGRPSSCW